MSLPAVNLFSFVIAMMGITFADLIIENSTNYNVNIQYPPRTVRLGPQQPVFSPWQEGLSRPLIAPSSNRTRGEVGNVHPPNQQLYSIGRNISRLRISQVPRLPPWNQGNQAVGESPQTDFRQLFELMGEPSVSRRRDVSGFIRPKPKCNRRIRIFNGVTRIRERGSLARFQCSHGFTLIGPTTVVCLRDRWSEAPPICVRGGCRPLRRPENGDMRQSIGESVAAFFCYPHAQLIGDPVIFCNGTKWNSTEPICHIDRTTTTEKESDEAWPVSVPPPPSPHESGEDHEHDETSWDTNNYQETFARSTTEFEDIISTSTDDVERIITTDFTEIFSTSDRLSYTNAEPGRQMRVTSEVPTEAQEPYTESEMPATLLPKVDILMGQNDSASENPHHLTSSVPPPPQPLPTIASLSTFPSSNPLSISVTNLPKVNISVVEPATNISATTAVPQRRTNPPRRVKILTKRPRRPTYTPRRSTRRPYRRRTTVKAIRSTLPPRRQRPTISRPTYFPPLSSTPTETEEKDNDAPSRVDYPIAIDKEFLPREQVQPIRPVLMPDMLNNNSIGDATGQRGHVSQVSMIGGIAVFVIGLSTFSAGAILYCWRKNKGIARASPYDMDGRTLSAHDANEDFMWLDQRDSRL